ncbi:hypothetical protein BKA63DRAFT_168435 [Paraphoma chrysanthemicola]|nr:hypothetical protein BKA63DRAFT_168435 [Paraphoma chrysanthemicola]
MDTAPPSSLLHLPAELRLHIAAYALEQPTNAGITDPKSGWIDREYDPTIYLNILLVCRQFHDDFAKLAFQKIRFIVKGHLTSPIWTLPVDKLRNLRKLAIRPTKLVNIGWHKYPFNNENLRLDELCIATDDFDFVHLTSLLRRLQHVTTIRILPKTAFASALYARLVGIMYKQDHHQRYDAPGAPDIGRVWFEPSFDPETMCIVLEAQSPQPVVLEEEYMKYMKPRIDALMNMMAQ